MVTQLKREAAVVVSGHLFPDEQDGPLFKAAPGSFQTLAVERAKFRMPWFSIAIEAIDGLFPIGASRNSPFDVASPRFPWGGEACGYGGRPC